jgi:hypothetical protein
MFVLPQSFQKRNQASAVAFACHIEAISTANNSHYLQVDPARNKLANVRLSPTGRSETGE